MTAPIRYKLAVSATGPILTTGLEARTWGVDNTSLRTPDGTRAILPGTLLHGNVVHVLEAMREAMQFAGSALLGELDSVLGWLGRGTQDARDDQAVGADLTPKRRSIRFGDLELEQGKSGATINRIMIDERTGSVRRGMLQTLDSPLGVGEEGVFSGPLLMGLSDTDAMIAERWIRNALGLVPALGAIKGAGFGRCVFNLERAPLSVLVAAKTAPALPASATEGRVRYQLTFDGPFLVASEAISGNIFRGATVVPGAAVKGALADMLERRGIKAHVDAALDSMIFRHARPAKSGGMRPRAIPLSIYAVQPFDNKLYDALARSPEEQSRAVAFQPDWKPGSGEEAKARKMYGHTFEPAYTVRTRTAISATGAAQTSQLFTHVAVKPEGYTWIGEIERGAADQGQFEQILAILRDGLDGIGKTKAAATVELRDAAPRKAEAIERGTDGTETWRIVLETDALMHGPDDVHVHAEVADLRERLHLHYRDYFAHAVTVSSSRTVTPNQITLTAFASQRWVGGYQARRFPHHHDRYYPQLLTEAGSVFLLSLPPGCDVAMRALAANGLPLPASVPSAVRQHQRSAFNPENGYGEVTIERRDLTAKPSEPRAGAK